jgi:hypothetical protein
MLHQKYRGKRSPEAGGASDSRPLAKVVPRVPQWDGLRGLRRRDKGDRDLRQSASICSLVMRSGGWARWSGVNRTCYAVFLYSAT